MEEYEKSDDIPVQDAAVEGVGPRAKETPLPAHTSRWQPPEKEVTGGRPILFRRAKRIQCILAGRSVSRSGTPSTGAGGSPCGFAKDKRAEAIQKPHNHTETHSARNQSQESRKADTEEILGTNTDRVSEGRQACGRIVGQHEQRIWSRLVHKEWR
jgi:hypothetical protein